MTQVREAGLAFVKNGPAEKRQAFYIERDFREPLCSFKEVIRLEARQRGDRVVRVRLRDRDDVVRLRIYLELALEKILKNEFVAQLRDVGDSVNVVGEFGPALERHSVASFRNVRPGDRGWVARRVVVLQEMGAHARPAWLVRSEADVGLKSEREPAPVPIIEPKNRFDVLRERHGHAAQNRGPP